MGPLILVLACSGPDPTDDAPPTSSSSPTAETAAPVTVEALAERAGFVVQQGTFGFLDPGDCCVECGNCLWNNPSTPYGSYELPPAPGQAVPNPEPNAAGPTFYLRSDEAVVFLGTTPPRARYFSWRSYLSERVVQPGDPVPPPVDPACEDAGDRALVIGSLGPSLNHLVVGERLGDAFDQPFALVTTADRAVEDEIAALLVEAGWDADHIFFDRLPAADSQLGLRLGFSDESDSFQLAVRIAVYDDPVAGSAYEAAPGQVLRLTPETERAPVSLHPRQALPAIGVGTDEQAFSASLDELGQAIRAAHPGYTPIEHPSTVWDYPTLDCIDDLYCSGEIRDRYYARVPRFWLLDNGSFAVAYGVNHERTGKASYANFAVDTVEKLIGLDSVASDRLVGSADSWMPGHPDLYAWVISRDCTEHPGRPCLEVGTECPTGVPITEPLFVSFRAYLEPATGAKPLGSELLPDRVIVFTPEATP